MLNFLGAVGQLPFAQSIPKIDSLLHELKTANTDTSKVHVLLHLGRQWVSAKDKTNSIQYFNEALSLAQKIAFRKGEAMAFYDLGKVCSIQSKYAEAIENYTTAHKIYRQLNDTNGVASSYLAIGISHKYLGNYPEAIKNQLLALETFEKINEKSGMANAYNNIGVLYKTQGNYKEALINYQQSLALVQDLDDRQLLATIYGNIGNVYFQQGDHPEALQNHTVALKLHRESGNKSGIALAYNSVGNIYAQENNYPEALHNYEASLAILVELDNKKGMATAYTNIGTLNKNMGHLDLAIENLQHALTISEAINDKKGMAQALHGLGSLYLNQGHLDEAMKSQYASLKIGEEIGSKDQILFSYQNIGFILIKQGCGMENQIAAKEKYAEAAEYYNKGLSLAQEIGSKDTQSKFYEALSEAYKLLENYPLSLDYLTRHIGLKDSIRSDENNRKLEQLRTQYEVEKALTAEKVRQDSLLKEQHILTERERAWMSARNLYHQQEIALLAKEKNLQQLRLEKNEADLLAQQILTEKKESDLMVQKAEAGKKQEQLVVLSKEKDIQQLELVKQRQAKYYFMGGFGLLAVLSFFIYQNFRTRQELRVQTLRNKIASDLHDDVGSTLSSISMFSQMAQSQSKDVIPALETINESSRKMLDAMADIVWTIKPENDQFDKVIMRMREFAFDLLGTKQIDFEFDANETISKINLSMEARKNLYLIFKEATNNMVKYSEAKRAKFVLHSEKDKLLMVISDNGKGFDPSKASRGNGLVNMRKRAEEMGAQLLIVSTPVSGTSISIELAV